MSALGIIIGARGGFPDHLILSANKKIDCLLKELGRKYYCLQNEEGFFGVKTYGDALQCANIFRTHSDEISGILVCLPNYGDEAAVSEAIRLSGLDVPILVQAEPDEIMHLGINERGGAYCGKLSLCNNLYQRDLAFTNTSRHVVAIDSAAFRKDLKNFIQICKVTKKLKTSRIGALGARIDSFTTLRYSEKLLMKSGITVCTEDLSTVIARAQMLESNEQIDKKVDEIRKYVDCGNFTREVLERLAKLAVVLEGWIKENSIDATSIACWDSLEEFYGCMPCLAMAMMTSAGMPSACENDVMSAVAMLALQEAAEAKPFCVDWYAPYAEKGEEGVLCIHCSNFAKEVFDGKAELSQSSLKALKFGSDRCTGTVKGKIKIDKLTYLGLTTDDKTGKIKAYLGDARGIQAESNTYSPYVILKIKELDTLMDYICKNGFEHHVAMIEGDVADVLEETLRTYMGWDVYRHYGM